MATKELASFCVDYSLEDFGLNVLQAVKGRIYDYLAVALGGSTLSSSKMVIELAKAQGGKPESTILSHKGRVPAPNAALANGTMAHGIELDDLHNDSSTHPAAPIVSAALAVAESEDVDGRSLAASIVVGYEVIGRIGSAVIGAHYAHGFHPTATCGTFGSAAAAGKILNLNLDQMVSALGIAGSQAAGSMEFLTDGAWTKRMHPGWAAHSGIMAALLAQKGYVGPSAILEGKQGFLKSYSDEYDMEKIAAGLGERLAITQISVKPHACCRGIHSTIDAVLNIVREHGVKPEEIEEVNIGLNKVFSSLLIEPIEKRYSPQNIVDAQFSVPYSVAVAILRDQVFVEEYTDKMLRNPEVLTLAQKVKARHEPELDEVYPRFIAAKAQFKLRDGTTYESRVDAAKGDPENPLTMEELQQKLRILAQGVVSEESLEEAIKLVSRLETLDDVNELTALLS